MLTQTLLIKITLYEEGVPLMIIGIAPASPLENSHDSVSLFDITNGEWKTAEGEPLCVEWRLSLSVYSRVISIAA